MSARQRILARLNAVAATNESLPAQIRPRVSGDLLGSFLAQLEAAAATFERVEHTGAIGNCVLAYRRRMANGGPTTIAPGLRDLDWPAELAVEFGSSDGRASLAVSPALAGVAETGSLALTSAPETPTRLNFLPDHHLVVLDPAQILPHLEDVWTCLGSKMPRAVNLVTGPSRTADVEQTIQLGAHGPRCLHVLLVSG